MENYNLKTNVRSIIESALLIAIIYIVTSFYFYLIPGNSATMVHVGTAALFIASIVFGKKQGAIGGAFGMGMVDMFSPYPYWAPYTFIIRLVMGYMTGAIACRGGLKGKSLAWNFIGMLVSSIWMIVGYYISEAIITHNIYAPIQSIPANILECLAGIVIGMPLIYALKKTEVFNKK